MKITLAVLVGLFLLVGGGAFVAPKLLGALGGLKPDDQATQVRTRAVEMSTLVEFVSAPGEVEPLTQVKISSQVSGRIIELPHRDGGRVSTGDVIVKLDDRDLQALLESVQAQHEAEQFRLQSEEARRDGLLSNLAFAQKELQRMQALYDTGDVSRKALDEAAERAEDLQASIKSTEFSISVIKSSLASANAEITRAQDGLDNTVIVAPMDGEITALNVEVGEQVLGTFNNIGSEIMTIADRSRMILKAAIPESDIARVAEGQTARIHINAYPDLTFNGSVTQIALQRTLSEDMTGIFEAEVEIDLEGRRIRSGLTANVDIEIASHEGLVVESQAIVEQLVDDLPESVRDSPLIDPDKRTVMAVYCVVDGKAVCTPVKPGASDLTHTIVDEGLEEGNVVIIGPYKALETLEHDKPVTDEADEAATDDAAETDTGPDTTSNETDTTAPATP